MLILLLNKGDILKYTVWVSLRAALRFLFLFNDIVIDTMVIKNILRMYVQLFGLFLSMLNLKLEPL